MNGVGYPPVITGISPSSTNTNPSLSTYFTSNFQTFMNLRPTYDIPLQKGAFITIDQSYSSTCTPTQNETAYDHGCILSFRKWGYAPTLPQNPMYIMMHIDRPHTPPGVVVDTSQLASQPVVIEIPQSDFEAAGVSSITLKVIFTFVTDVVQFPAHLTVGTVYPVSQSDPQLSLLLPPSTTVILATETPFTVTDYTQSVLNIPRQFRFPPSMFSSSSALFSSSSASFSSSSSASNISSSSILVSSSSGTKSSSSQSLSSSSSSVLKSSSSIKPSSSSSAPFSSSSILAMSSSSSNGPISPTTVQGPCSENALVPVSDLVTCTTPILTGVIILPNFDLNGDTRDQWLWPMVSIVAAGAIVIFGFAFYFCQ